jgi:hypothetical protein
MASTSPAEPTERSAGHLPGAERDRTVRVAAAPTGLGRAWASTRLAQPTERSARPPGPAMSGDHAGRVAASRCSVPAGPAPRRDCLSRRSDGPTTRPPALSGDHAVRAARVGADRSRPEPRPRRGWLSRPPPPPVCGKRRPPRSGQSRAFDCWRSSDDPPRHRREPAARVAARRSVLAHAIRRDLPAGSARCHEASRPQPLSLGNSALPFGASSSGVRARWGSPDRTTPEGPTSSLNAGYAVESPAHDQR